MKFTKTHEKQLREYMAVMDPDGCVPVTEWTSGSGRHTSKRALPPFVAEYERREYKLTALPKHGTPERTAYRWLKANPRRKKVLVLDLVALTSFLMENARGAEI